MLVLLSILSGEIATIYYGHNQKQLFPMAYEDIYDCTVADRFEPSLLFSRAALSRSGACSP